MPKKTTEEISDMLSDFDLLLSIVQSDCGRYKYLKKVKKKVQDARDELRNIPIQA